MSFLVLLAVWALSEWIWRLVPALRAQRWQLRLHLGLFAVLVTCIYVGTVWQLVPERFHYGNGVLRYASDSLTYQGQAVEVAESLRRGSLDGMLDRQKPTYSKLLGVVFAVAGPDNLAAMFVNGFFYMATLACVFLIGREMFGTAAGAFAMAAASLWPGFVLHEAQTIRWVTTTLGLQLVVLGCVMLIGRGAGAWALLATVTGYVLLLSDQAYLARIVSVFVATWGVGLMAGAMMDRSLLRPALQTLAVGVMITGLYYAVYADSGQRALEASAPPVTTDPGGAKPADANEAGSVGFAAIERVTRAVEGNVSVALAAREGFDRANLEGQTGTALPAPPLGGPGAVLQNVPRAIVTAAFAPFPNLLLSGTPGTSNLRQFVVVEFVPYLLIVIGAGLAMVAVLTGGRGDLLRQTAFVVLLVLIAYALLGTVVLNGGTLYRFRQPYVLLQIVLAAHGWLWIAGVWRRRTGAHAR